jgi:lambda repressor-like predicted transcriptional regulator
MSARKAIQAAVNRDGLLPTARRLGVVRSTLASYLARSCREGTALLVESRAERLTEKAA